MRWGTAEIQLLRERERLWLLLLATQCAQLLELDRRKQPAVG